MTKRRKEGKKMGAEKWQNHGRAESYNRGYDQIPMILPCHDSALLIVAPPR